MTLITYPFHYQHIHNFYSEEELTSIWEELDEYQNKNQFTPPEETCSATIGEKILKSNSGLWLYNRENPIDSKIANISTKLNRSRLINHPSSWFFKDVMFNCDSLLVSYYDDGDHYLRHNDSSYVTACIWLYKEPKKFLGGDFYFPDYDIKIKCENNSCVVFPSNIFHSVSKVHIPEEYQNKGFGRYCITKFISIHLGLEDDVK